MPKKYPSMAEMIETLPEPTHESEYRRGYRDGFFAGIYNMDGLMFAYRLSREEAYDRCHRFWLVDLGKWQVTDVDNRLFWPPRLA